jgi:hypothetical protein
MVISPNKWELDTQAYLNICNITSTTPRQQLRDFAAGVNDLGLWNSMVCWPLRSTQNAGTGTTAYSLGGLGTFNGTLVDGPIWGADGITYDGVNDRITTSFTLGAAQVFCGVVGSTPTSGGGGYFYGGVNSASEPIYWVNPRTSTGAEYWYNLSRPSLGDNTTAGVHMWSTVGGAGLNTKAYRSITLLGTAAAAASAPSPLTLSSGLVLGRFAGGYSGTAAIAFIIHAAPASPNAFYDLYKSTLGTGLGLP